MMKFKMLMVLILVGFSRVCLAQEMPANITAAIKNDDSVQMAGMIDKDNINGCYAEGDYQYTLLAQTIRHNAIKCFHLLIEKGADVNKACNGYVPPIMHAAKYGRLEMVKALIEKGAAVNYTYSGDYEPANGQTPLTYAEKFNQAAVVEYLKTVKTKQ